MDNEPGTPDGSDVKDLLDLAEDLDEEDARLMAMRETLSDSAVGLFMQTNSSVFEAIQTSGPPSVIEAVVRVQVTSIAERHKTRRLGFVVSAVLTLAAAAILVFAPENRESVAEWVGAALFTAAVGAAGFTHVRFKLPGTSLKMDSKK